jgi:hypothetical protein
MTNLKTPRNALIDMKKIIGERAYFKWLDGSNDQVKNWIEAEREIRLLF